MDTILSFTSHLLRHTRTTNSIIPSTENTPLLPLHNTSPPNSSNSFNEKTAYQTICSTTDECDTNNLAKKPVGIKACSTFALLPDWCAYKSCRLGTNLLKACLRSWQVLINPEKMQTKTNCRMKCWWKESSVA